MKVETIDSLVKDVEKIVLTMDVTCRVSSEKMNSHLRFLENLFQDETKLKQEHFGMFGAKGKITSPLIHSLGNKIHYQPHGYDYMQRILQKRYDESVHKTGKPPADILERPVVCDRVVCKDKIEAFRKEQDILINKIKNHLNSDDVRLILLTANMGIDRFKTKSPMWQRYKDHRKVTDLNQIKFYLVYTKNPAPSLIKKGLDLLKIPWYYKNTHLRVMCEEELDVNFDVAHILDFAPLEKPWDEELFETVNGLYQNTPGGLTLIEAVEAAKQI